MIEIWELLFKAQQRIENLPSMSDLGKAQKQHIIHGAEAIVHEKQSFLLLETQANEFFGPVHTVVFMMHVIE